MDCSRRSTHRHDPDDGDVAGHDPAVASHPPAACSAARHLAGARWPWQAAAAQMEPACGYRNTGAWLPGTSICLCDETDSRCRSRESHRSHRPSCYLAFFHSHVHLRNQHAVVVAERVSRQNRHSWRVEARWRHCHGHLCELCHRAIHATILLKNEYKAAQSCAAANGDWLSRLQSARPVAAVAELFLLENMGAESERASALINSLPV
jgi:hypothetical protein